MSDIHSQRESAVKFFAMFVLASMGVVVGVLVREPFGLHLPRPDQSAEPLAVQPPAVPTPKTGPSLEALREQARRRIAPALASADRECARLIEDPIKDLDRYFANVKTRTPKYAEYALGWGSKWRLGFDKLPFTRTDRHEQYLREGFHQHLFTPADLERQLRQAVKAYLDSVRSAEDQMLVRVRADVRDLPPGLLICAIDQQLLQRNFAEAMTLAAESAGASLQDDVAQQLISVVVGEVLVAATVRLGVSAGLLGAGAASGWATFGIGGVVGLIVDQLVSWVWDWWANPVGSLTSALDGKIDELRAAIVEGTANAPGLRQRLQQFARERASVRRAALLELAQQQ